MKRGRYSTSYSTNCRHARRGNPAISAFTDAFLGRSDSRHDCSLRRRLRARARARDAGEDRIGAETTRESSLPLYCHSPPLRLRRCSHRCSLLSIEFRVVAAPTRNYATYPSPRESNVRCMNETFVGDGSKARRRGFLVGVGTVAGNGEEGMFGVNCAICAAGRSDQDRPLTLERAASKISSGT